MEQNRSFFIQHPSPKAFKATAKRFNPGIMAEQMDFDPGDFILTHSNCWTGRIIRWGQRLRFRGRRRKYAWWNHTALIVSKKGDIIEAFGKGVVSDNISKYTQAEYTVVRIHPELANAQDREEVVVYGKWALDEKYGYLTIVSIALNLIFGGKFSFFIDGQTICSGLVARALERTRIIFDRSPSHIMPADLAAYFEVEPPTTESSQSGVPTCPSQ